MLRLDYKPPPLGTSVSGKGWLDRDRRRGRSERAGTSAEINAALRLMELTFPLSPEAITQRYRELAMRWHPDHNPGNPESTRRFQKLGEAMELLTGVDLSQLSASETERSRYQQVLHRSSITLPGGRMATFSIAMHVGGAFGADWIYAANFARTAHSTFLAGYSGRVIEVNAAGLPMRVYDIGAVPAYRKHQVIYTSLPTHGSTFCAKISLRLSWTCSSRVS